ncbi:PREDICTED: RCC1 and BTB domain-containing protein 1-like [Trachymyrmex septentrionalis]|uniref:RCC1 and BTB domain-containing protein 1-like n=1 Tax=Trachymyrmex septentrionalis TaxID=34720 RepID=UPI00084EDBFD|nr:PREDICTED: RCC1 and BTB domain-containing protein 1-like [Trachymyrmex septentrionalis]
MVRSVKWHDKYPLFRKRIKLFINTYGFIPEKDHLGSSILVTESGEKYLWANCQTSRENTRKNRCFTKISQWPDEIDWTNTRIVQSSVNNDDILVFTDNAKLYHFHLRCHELHIELSTRKIVTQLEYEEARVCACGNSFFIFITNEEEIYECTNTNLNGRLAHLSNLLSDKLIVKIAAGFLHTLVLTDKGKVYGWGTNTHGQLNFNENEVEQLISPCKILIPNVRKVSDIAAMKFISAFKSSYDGLVYIQGCLHGKRIRHLAVCEYTNIFDRYNSSFHSLKEDRIYTEEEDDLLDDLKQAFNDSCTSDLTIQVKGQPIYVHKSILKMRSLYFKNMFEFNESENRKRVIKYDDHSYQAYKDFFKFLYTGWVFFDNLSDMIELLILADKYCESNLEKKCIDQLRMNMNPLTVSFIKQIAEKYNKMELNEYCLIYQLRMAYDPMEIFS